MSNITIIGSGQQGSSIARSLTQKHNITCYDINEANLNELSQLVDGVNTSNDLAVSLKNAEIVIFATPISEFGNIAREISSHVEVGTIFTDVGSGKVKAIKEISENLDEEHRPFFIPGHPIAGASGAGPSFSKPDMYKGKKIVLVPQEGQDEAAFNAVKAMWEDAGATTADMDAESHDRLYGTLSHFQHVAAFSLTKVAASPDSGNSVRDDFKDAGSSYLMTTRIANASLPMWRAIFKDNKDAIIEAAYGFYKNLNRVQELIMNGQEKQLLALSTKAYDYRKQFEDKKPREVLAGELDRLGGDLSDIARGEKVDLAYVVALALTLNAMEIDEKLGEYSLVELANPSFLDGSAPVVQTNPEAMTKQFLDNGPQIGIGIKKFRAAFLELSADIEKGLDDKICQTIEQVNSLRSELPPFMKPDEVRDDYRLDLER